MSYSSLIAPTVHKLVRTLDQHAPKTGEPDTRKRDALLLSRVPGCLA
jgi:hypothetical protein